MSLTAVLGNDDGRLSIVHALSGVLEALYAGVAARARPSTGAAVRHVQLQWATRNSARCRPLRRQQHFYVVSAKAMRKVVSS